MSRASIAGGMATLHGPGAKSAFISRGSNQTVANDTDTNPSWDSSNYSADTSRYSSGSGPSGFSATGLVVSKPGIYKVEINVDFDDTNTSGLRHMRWGGRAYSPIPGSVTTPLMDTILTLTAAECNWWGGIYPPAHYLAIMPDLVPFYIWVKVRQTSGGNLIMSDCTISIINVLDL